MAIKPLNSVAGFSVGETPANIILANGDITTTNITTTGVANLNAIGNVKMSGGSSGQVIQTDGAGNLSFVTISTSSLQNGTSNIQVLSSANLTFSSAGNANVVVITGSGEVVNGTLSVVGNANIGNIGTGLITATGNITGANLFTGGILSATGNANVGNLGTAGLITATGNIGGGNINTGGIVSATGNANVGNVNTTGVFATTLSSTGNANVGNLGTGGLITATGNIGGGNLNTGGVLSVTGNANIGNIGTAGLVTATGNIQGGNLKTAGIVSAGGNATVAGILTDNYYYANGAPVDFQQAAGSNTQIQFNNNNDFGASANFTFNTATNLLTVTGSESVTGNANIGNIGTGGLITATGNITGGNLIATANITVNNFITTPGGSDLVFTPGTSVTRNYGNLDPYTGGYYLGGVVRWTGLRANSGDFATTLNVTGNANVGNLGTGGLITATGNITGGNIVTAGTANAAILTVSGNANIGNIGTAGVITAGGTVTGGNLATAGTLSVGGNANVGNIGTTNLVATGGGSFGSNLNMNSFNIVSLATPTNPADATTKQYVDDLVATGLAYHEPVYVATVGTLATATGGTMTYNNGTAGVGATLTTTGTFLLIDGANVQTVGTRILVKNEGNAAWNGVYTYTNATTITRSADTDTYGPTSTTDLSLNDYFFVQAGDVNEGSAYVCTTVGTITFGTTNITFALFSTSQVYDAGTGLTLTNTTFSVNPSQTQVTAVGTLTSLSVSGNANIGNIGTAGLITATGNLGAGNVNTTGVFATTLSATGNANVGNIGTAGLITATGNITGGNIVTAGTANAAILTVSGNANIGNIGTAGLITATGNITGGNLVTSGTANAAILTVSGNANIGNIGTGGLITATGNITGGNIITSGVMSSTGNVTGGNIVTGGLITATGNVTGGNVIATNGANVGTILGIGNGTVNTSITWASVTTSAITANQTIANISVTGVTGIEYLVKAVDSAGSKYSVATVQAVTDGTSVDYATFGTVQLGGYTGSLAVNVSGGYIKLQVTPASTNSTVWTTQYRLI